MADGIQGGQHVVPLPPRGAGDEQPHQAPEEAEEWAVDEVSRIHKQYGPFAAFGLAQAGPEPGLQEVGLLLRVRLGRDRPGLAPAQAEIFFRNARTRVRPRRTPVCCSMAAWASRVERGGFWRK